MSDFNPDANPETTTVDGRVGRIAVAEDWNTIRVGAGNFADDSATNANAALIRKDAGVTWSAFVRSPFLFDTHTIGSGAVILSATLKLYVVSTESTIAKSVRVVSATPASNTALVQSDYANFGTAALANDVLCSSLTTSAYNTWTLNAAGIAAINTTGITKLGVRIDADADNTEPSATNGQAAAMEVQFADGANKPTLTVAFTLGGAYLLTFVAM